MTTIQQMLLGGESKIPDFVSFGNKLPIYGTGGGTYPPPGWTGIQNANADDQNLFIGLPFTFYIAGSGYTAAYMGSNTYLTFGSGSNEWSGLSAFTPALPKFMFGAADNSYQRVSRFTSGTAYQRIRYEGAASTSGTVGSPNIVLEITLFNPANYDGYSVLELLTGNHGRTGGARLVANSSTEYATYSQSSNASYVFVGSGIGNSWAIYSNSYVNNTDY
jgi:hypothetical protein